MKTLSNKILLFATLSACALLSGQVTAEPVAVIGANLIAYHGVSTSGQVTAEPVAVIGENLIAYHRAVGSNAEATGSFCSTASAKKVASNFSAGANGLLSARTTC